MRACAAHSSRSHWLAAGGGAGAGEAAAGAAMLRSLGSFLCLWALRLPVPPVGSGAAARGLDVASYR